MEKEEQRYGYRWMARETMFSSSKGSLVNMYLLLGFKLVKEMVLKYLCTTYLEEWYKENENWLMRASYAIGHLQTINLVSHILYNTIQLLPDKNI